MPRTSCSGFSICFYPKQVYCSYLISFLYCSSEYGRLEIFKFIVAGFWEVMHLTQRIVHFPEMWGLKLYVERGWDFWLSLTKPFGPKEMLPLSSLLLLPLFSLPLHHHYSHFTWTCLILMGLRLHRNMVMLTAEICKKLEQQEISIYSANSVTGESK